MNCWTAKRRSADYVDGELRAGERWRLESHLSRCASCAVRVDQTRSLRSALASLPEPVLPIELRTALAVTASRERRAVIERRGSRLKRVWNRWRFRLDEIMRPLTIPATGGLLSSLILFGALGFTIG